MAAKKRTPKAAKAAPAPKTPKATNPYPPGTAASEAWIHHPWTRKGATAPEA